MHIQRALLKTEARTSMTSIRSLQVSINYNLSYWILFSDRTTHSFTRLVPITRAAAKGRKVTERTLILSPEYSGQFQHILVLLVIVQSYNCSFSYSTD